MVVKTPKTKIIIKIIKTFLYFNISNVSVKT